MTDPIVLQSTGDVKGPASATDNSMVLFSGTSGKVIKGNNAVVTAAGLALLDDNNNTEQRNTLGLGTMATQNSNAVTITGGNISGLATLHVTGSSNSVPTAADGTSTTQIASTAFVQNNIGSKRPYSVSNPLMDGVVSQGTAANVSRSDHRHPTDTSRAPLLSPAFTGTPTAPNVATGANNTQIANTAYVHTLFTSLSIGWNQSWQEVGRSFGVTYQNNTYKPIMILGAYYGVSSGGGYTGVQITINGVTLPFARDANSSGGTHLVGTIIIPAGASYRLDIDPATSSTLQTASHWELRS